MKIAAANTNVRVQDHNLHSVVPIPEIITPTISLSNQCTVTSATNLPLAVPPSNQCVATSTAVHNTLSTLKPTEAFTSLVQASSATTNAEKSCELLPSVVQIVAGFESITSDEDIDTVRNEVVDTILKETLGKIMLNWVFLYSSFVNENRSRHFLCWGPFKLNQGKFTALVNAYVFINILIYTFAIFPNSSGLHLLA